MPCTSWHGLRKLIFIISLFEHGYSLTCYSRSGTSGTNGSVTTCGSETTCYAYTSTADYAGCGSCSSYSTLGYSCSSCSTDLCNYKVPTINCYTTAASVSFSSRTKTTCSGFSSCYQYSYTSIRTDFFFSGCGDCSRYISENPTCTNCTTDYCNSATALGRLDRDFQMMIVLIATIFVSSVVAY